MIDDRRMGGCIELGSVTARHIIPNISYTINLSVAASTFCATLKIRPIRRMIDIKLMLIRVALLSGTYLHTILKHHALGEINIQCATVLSGR